MIQARPLDPKEAQGLIDVLIAESVCRPLAWNFLRYSDRKRLDPLLLHGLIRSCPNVPGCLHLTYFGQDALEQHLLELQRQQAAAQSPQPQSWVQRGVRLAMWLLGIRQAPV